MLPPKLKELRRALRETLPRPGGDTPARSSARRAAETLELARAAERDAESARLTPAEFRRLYGYEPKDAGRMLAAAELLAYGRGGGRERPGLETRSDAQVVA